MATIHRLRCSWPDPDRTVKRKVRSIEHIATGIMMGTFTVNRQDFHHCIKSSDDLADVWYEVGIDFPLVKTYEELFDEKVRH